MRSACFRRALLVTALAAAGFVSPCPAQAEDALATAIATHAEEPVADMTLLNFFEGWNQPWIHRHRYTPNMALLKVTTNFLEREFRLDYSHTEVRGNPKQISQDLLNGLIAYGLNRRLMLEVVSNYQWNNGPPKQSTNGAGGAALARIQLIDTATSSYAIQARVNSPNKPIGTTQTSLQYAIGGWQDIHALVPALGRMGLYYSFQYENFQGVQKKANAKQNDVSYDVSLAETWTQPSTPVLGNFTTFVEAYGTTDLDGSTKGHTLFTLTPGIRFWFVADNSITLGADLPVSYDPSIKAVYRATYIMNF